MTTKIKKPDGSFVITEKILSGWITHLHLNVEDDLYKTLCCDLMTAIHEDGIAPMSEYIDCVTNSDAWSNRWDNLVSFLRSNHSLTPDELDVFYTELAAVKYHEGDPSWEQANQFDVLAHSPERDWFQGVYSTAMDWFQAWFENKPTSIDVIGRELTRLSIEGVYSNNFIDFLKFLTDNIRDFSSEAKGAFMNYDNTIAISRNDAEAVARILPFLKFILKDRVFIPPVASQMTADVESLERIAKAGEALVKDNN